MMTCFASLVTKLSIPLLLSITTVILPPSGLAQETVFPSTEQPPSRSLSFLPTVDCQDTPSWRIYYVSPGSITGQYLFCHDNEVECYFKGAIGNKGYIPDAPASEHCCKCKLGCAGFCLASPEISNDGEKEKEDPSAVTYIVIGVAAVVCCIASIRANQRIRMQHEISSTRRTMSERRRQRLQSDLADSPPTPTRDEQIWSNFYFQRVLPDNSRTALETRAALQSGEQETTPPDSSVRPDNSNAALEESPQNEDEENLAGSHHKTQREPPSSRSVLSVLSQRLSSWRKPSSSDECCICLDGYHPGETICAPITNKCNHAFHEECVVEWLRDHDVCPLCRVNLME